MATVQKRVALVTGANRGIGLEVSRQLAKQGYQVLMTSRNVEKGKESTEKLRAEGLEVLFQPLDVTRQESVDRVFDFVSKELGRLDVLINNAGILIDKSSSTAEGDGASFFKSNLETIQKTLETNTFGPIRMIQKFAPLMLKNRYGRIVNISSGMGALNEMNGGWPGYRISKTALNAVTRIAADELQGSPILVNSACPGWVKTDMGGPEAERTTAEAADGIVWLATLPENGPTGGFFRDKKPIDW